MDNKTLTYSLPEIEILAKNIQFANDEERIEFITKFYGELLAKIVDLLAIEYTSDAAMQSRLTDLSAEDLTVEDMIMSLTKIYADIPAEKVESIQDKAFDAVLLAWTKKFIAEKKMTVDDLDKYQFEYLDYIKKVIEDLNSKEPA